MYLFFDTETTGINKSRDRTIQIGWILANELGKEIEKRCFIIKPSGFSIPAAATAIHKISTERAHLEGKDLALVLKQFLKSLDQASFLVAHNIDFDIAILRHDLSELGYKDPFSDKNRICTMRASTSGCWTMLPKTISICMKFQYLKNRQSHFWIFWSQSQSRRLDC